jgi:hypothetical protein
MDAGTYAAESARIQRICARRKFSSRYSVHTRVNGRGRIEHHLPAPSTNALPGSSSHEPDAVSSRTRPSMTCTSLAWVNTARRIGSVRTLSTAARRTLPGRRSASFASRAPERLRSGFGPRGSAFFAII